MARTSGRPAEIMVESWRANSATEPGCTRWPIARSAIETSFASPPRPGAPTRGVPLGEACTSIDTGVSCSPESVRRTSSSLCATSMPS